jgi:hypothetical protein
MRLMSSWGDDCVTSTAPHQLVERERGDWGVAKVTHQDAEMEEMEEMEEMDAAFIW